MCILKSEIDLQGSKPRYLRTTKHLYSHIVNGRELFFSYQTLVAIDDLISVNDWSVTTGRHLYWINPNKEIRVDDFEEQARKLLKDDDLISCDDPLKSSDPLKTVSNISRIFALMSESDTEESIRKSNNQRKRFYETINGISFPSDWESLDTATQKRRLDICDYVNTDKAKEYIEGVK